MKKVFLTVVAACMLMLAAPNAKADVVEQWQYTSDAVFVSWTDVQERTGNALNNNTAITGIGWTKDLAYDSMFGYPVSGGSQKGYTGLRWGSNYDYSSIGLQKQSGTLQTNGQNGAGVSLWHDNHTISASYSTLQAGSVLLTLDLDPVNGTLDAGTFGILLDFYFIETLNGASGSTEHDPDIFIVKEPLEVASQRFMHDGVEYEFSFEASFKPLEGWFLEEAQRLLGTDDILYGWTTLEGQTSEFNTSFSIKTITPPAPVPTPTPEPGTMLLMGLGLAGLGFMTRRRKLQNKR